MDKKSSLLKTTLLAASCLLVSACSNNSSEPTGPIADVYWAYSTENLLSDFDYRCELDEDGDPIEENKQYLDRDKTLRFDCLQGENEGVQLMVYANRFISNFDFVLPEKLVSGSNEISGNNLSVAVEHYMDVSGSIEKSLSGWYPDACIPLENYKWRRMNFIEKDRNQGLYFNFLSTADMVPGKYEGTGKLKLDKEVIDIPFEITIYEGVMPTEVHYHSDFLIWYDQIASGEKERDCLELQQKYYDFVVSKRVNPDSMPEVYEASPTVFAEAFAEKIANNIAVSTYRMPFTGAMCNEETIKEWLGALIDKNIEMRNKGDTKVDFFKKLLFYVDDEPTQKSYPDVRKHDKAIYEAKKALAYRLAGYPDLYDSFIHLKNLVTAPHNPDLYATEEEGGVQTWCPQFQHFQTQKNRDLYKSRQNSNDRTGGENVWWYGCMDPITPYSSYHLDADLLNSRIIPYMTWNYEIEGQVYWCVNYFSKHQNGVSTGRDIWNDANNWERCAGDGQLLYPGLEFGIDGPITTLRLESILGSFEEFEYLYLIEENVKKYNEDNGLEDEYALDVRSILSKYLSRIFTNVIATKDDDAFNEVRLELLKIVSAFAKDTFSGIQALLKA